MKPSTIEATVRRWIARVSGALLALALLAIVAVMVVHTSSGGDAGLLIGGWTSSQIVQAAVVVAFASLTAGLCLVSTHGWWLALMIPARILAIAATVLAGFSWMLTSSATVVPLRLGGCDTGYVVTEDSFLFAAWGAVHRQDGLLIEPVERFGADDGYHPFADGAYVAESDDSTIRVWYRFARSYDEAPVSTEGAPAFTLPALDRPGAVPCTPRVVVVPTPPVEQLPLTAADARAEVTRMAEASLAAAVDPVTDAAGHPFDADALTPIASACGETGSQSALALTLRTGDNAASLARILAVWDDAGYAPDRAMQQDIRYSETLPIATMTIRDKTTIDGLIHVQITSRCGVVK